MHCCGKNKAQREEPFATGYRSRARHRKRQTRGTGPVFLKGPAAETGSTTRAAVYNISPKII